MDIKKLIRSQRVRHKLMYLGRFIPDLIMITLQYRLLLKRWPNLKSPKRFTEWIQVYKIKYRNPLLLQCADKYSVREYVAKSIGDEYLPNVYQVCSTVDEIDFNNFPNKFVIKTTSGGNGDNVLIVHDKTVLDYDKIKITIKKWLKKNYSNTSREWAYTLAAVNPQIIIEEYLEDDSSGGLMDYKFFCFNGECKFFKVDFNRYLKHQANYYTPQGDLLNCSEAVCPADPRRDLNLSKEQIEKMVIIAQHLSKGFPFVRVDLYKVYNRIIFGELTFYPASGYGEFIPDSFDEEAGKYFPKIEDPIWSKYKVL